MATFPKRPDFAGNDPVKDYIRYMVEQLEYKISTLEKEISDIKVDRK